MPPQARNRPFARNSPRDRPCAAGLISQPWGILNGPTFLCNVSGTRDQPILIEDDEDEDNNDVQPAQTLRIEPATNSIIPDLGGLGDTVDMMEDSEVQETSSRTPINAITPGFTIHESSVNFLKTLVSFARFFEPDSCLALPQSSTASYQGNEHYPQTSQAIQHDVPPVRGAEQERLAPVSTSTLWQTPYRPDNPIPLNTSRTKRKVETPPWKVSCSKWRLDPATVHAPSSVTASPVDQPPTVAEEDIGAEDVSEPDIRHDVSRLSVSLPSGELDGVPSTAIESEEEEVAHDARVRLSIERETSRTASPLHSDLFNSDGDLSRTSRASSITLHADTISSRGNLHQRETSVLSRFSSLTSLCPSSPAPPNASKCVGISDSRMAIFTYALFLITSLEPVSVESITESINSRIYPRHRIFTENEVTAALQIMHSMFDLSFDGELVCLPRASPPPSHSSSASEQRSREDSVSSEISYTRIDTFRNALARLFEEMKLDREDMPTMGQVYDAVNNVLPPRERFSYEHAELALRELQARRHLVLGSDRLITWML